VNTIATRLRKPMSCAFSDGGAQLRLMSPAIAAVEQYDAVFELQARELRLHRPLVEGLERKPLLPFQGTIISVRFLGAEHYAIGRSEQRAECATSREAP
jgi:hypothetical protein